MREGWLWRPLSRLIGDPSGADELWWTKREVFARLVSGPSIRDFADEMAATISTAVAEMAARGRDGRALDAGEEMARIVYRAITRVLIGNKITDEQADRLGAALRTTSASMRPRLMFPFVPNAVPFAGDRRFRRSVAGIDEMVFPIVDRARRRGPDGRDIVSRLLEARTSDGRGFTRQELRDGMVSLFVAGTETTTIAMTFLWTVLRLYPPGWMLPRKVVDDDVIGGAPVKAGGLIVMSPYLTNRLPELWDRPEEFAPSRHDPGAQQPAFSYLTFGGGPHACVGKPFFLAEVQLIIAAVLSTLHVTVLGAPSARPQLGLTLRPRERTMLRLIPRTATGGDGRVSGDG
ncbi:cytochrome P450 [Actinomadura nitritigenes]|uniref:Cytochrome P450 n=1 Tax=Actinomadura nitritigenes TaxID=134602 RepID=A0ABS3QX09_9ACTN|nr:cytochrome P450 [Actinomadura nitritigenes]MBO2438520.1 cytochrome P450 [Actinomadura nitritigenes]